MTVVDPNNESTFHVCVVPSDLREINLPKQTILSELDRHQYSEESIFGIKLALEEALTNAVKHGNRSDPDKKVIVRYAVTSDRMVVIVRDEGGGFLPENVPDCLSPDRLPVPNGRGILLMKAYMDEVCYRDKGREVYFMKRRCSMSPGACCCASIRRTTYFSGSVQGVGFRYTTRDLASRFKVTGFVRNLSDDRVELVAEGSEVEIDRFEAAIESAMQRHIESASSHDGPASDEFKGFSIRN